MEQKYCGHFWQNENSFSDSFNLHHYFLKKKKNVAKFLSEYILHCYSIGGHINLTTVLWLGIHTGSITMFFSSSISSNILVNLCWYILVSTLAQSPSPVYWLVDHVDWRGFRPLLGSVSGHTLLNTPQLLKYKLLTGHYTLWLYTIHYTGKKTLNTAQHIQLTLHYTLHTPQ